MTPLLDHKNIIINAYAAEAIADIHAILSQRDADENDVKMVNSIQDVLDDMKTRLKRDKVIPS